jgi:hypothetical protein
MASIINKKFLHSIFHYMRTCKNATTVCDLSHNPIEKMNPTSFALISVHQSRLGKIIVSAMFHE